MRRQVQRAVLGTFEPEAKESLPIIIYKTKGQLPSNREKFRSNVGTAYDSESFKLHNDTLYIILTLLYLSINSYCLENYQERRVLLISFLVLQYLAELYTNLTVEQFCLYFMNLAPLTYYKIFVILECTKNIFGAVASVAADAKWGKISVLLYTIPLQLVGFLLWLCSSERWTKSTPLAELALFSIAFIKIGMACSSPSAMALLGDQHVLPQDDRKLLTSITIVYVFQNIGAIIVCYLTYFQRHFIECFSQFSCYPIGIFFGCVTTITSMVIFFPLANKILREIPPNPKIFYKFYHCYKVSKELYKYSEDHKVDFLTFGEQYFGKRLCNDVKRLYVTLILIPLTASWLIIFDFPKINQYLAERMKVHSVALRMYFVEVNVSAHVVTLMIIPPLYLLFTKLRKPLRDLQWIGIGIFLLACGTLLAAMLTTYADEPRAKSPIHNSGHFRIYNNLDCKLYITAPRITDSPLIVPPFSMEMVEQTVEAYIRLPYNFTCGKHKGGGTVRTNDGEHSSYYLNDSFLLHKFLDDPIPSRTHLPKIRFLMNTRDQPHVTCNATVANGKKFVFRIRSNDIEQYEISIGKYNVMINGQIYGHYRFMREGVYVVFVLQKPNGKYKVAFTTVTDPVRLHVLWMAFHLCFFCSGSYILFVYIIKFLYRESPPQVKSTMLYLYFAEKSIGHLTQISLTLLMKGYSEIRILLLFAGLQMISLIVFLVLSMYYKYADLTYDTDKHLGLMAR